VPNYRLYHHFTTEDNRFFASILSNITDSNWKHLAVEAKEFDAMIIHRRSSECAAHHLQKEDAIFSWSVALNILHRVDEHEKGSLKSLNICSIYSINTLINIYCISLSFECSRCF
jgi:hypothetical protein